MCPVCCVFRHILCVYRGKESHKTINLFLKQTSKSTVYPLNSLHWFHQKYCPSKGIELSDISLYITINRCIITIRINTALIDYLANIRNSIGLIKTQSESLSQEIDPMRQLVIYKVLEAVAFGAARVKKKKKGKKNQSSHHCTVIQQAAALSPSTCSVQ